MGCKLCLFLVRTKLEDLRSVFVKIQNDIQLWRVQYFHKISESFRVSSVSVSGEPEDYQFT